MTISINKLNCRQIIYTRVLRIVKHFIFTGDALTISIMTFVVEYTRVFRIYEHFIYTGDELILQ